MFYFPLLFKLRFAEPLSQSPFDLIVKHIESSDLFLMVGITRITVRSVLKRKLERNFPAVIRPSRMLSTLFYIGVITLTPKTNYGVTNSNKL